MVQSVVINIKNTDVLKTGIVFSQGDKGTEAELQIFVKDDEAYVLNAEKAEISFKRADGHVVIGELTGSDGVYSYHFSGNELQSAGEAVATVTLTFSDGRISSGAFSFQVRYNPMFDKSIEAGPYIWQLEKIVENAKTYTEYLKNLIAQLKPEVGSTALTKADLLNDFSQTAAGLKAMDAAAGKRIWDNFGKYIPSGKIVNNLLATQAGNVLDATQGKVLGDKVAKVEQSITELNSELVWKAGDSYSISNFCTAGFLTGSKTEVYFSIPLSKPTSATKVVVSDLGLSIRQNNSYIWGTATDHFPANKSVGILGDGYIVVTGTIDPKDNATNNDACGVWAKASISFQ